ncbi:hypothetical protein FACS1894171_0450 [Clostridia bacterium]|nr:hypothetical protein FACS1894171_0450 [Clostridia bacterium]
MKKEAIISIHGKHSYGLPDENDVELVTAGCFYRTNGDYFISYKESALTGLEGTTTTVKVERGRVTLLRYGEISSQQVFEQDRKHFSYYDTDLGAMTIGVSARRVKTAMNDAGGDIEVDYAIEVDHTVTGESAFKINVRALPS